VKDDKLYLIHISESIDKIDEYVVGLDFAGFNGKAIVQDAVLRNVTCRCSLNQLSVFRMILSRDI